MTTFDTTFVAAAWPALAAEFGATATYTPLGGSSSSITVILHEQPAADPFTPDGEQALRAAVIHARPADVAAPQRGDTVAIDSVTWAVVEVTDRAPLVALQCEARTHVRLGQRSAPR